MASTIRMSTTGATTAPSTAPMTLAAILVELSIRAQVIAACAVEARMQREPKRCLGFDLEQDAVAGKRHQVLAARQAASNGELHDLPVFVQRIASNALRERGAQLLDHRHQGPFEVVARGARAWATTPLQLLRNVRKALTQLLKLFRG